ncbi:hypothetical protein MP228_000758 [Amoeboaphelidium protococcarum]|nr:hypothetical protein MP228_000758 [Amoeboaphelidium protococcarum]
MPKIQDSFGRTTIQASNLDQRVTDQLLASIFSTAGPIVSIRTIHDRASGSTSTSYIEYKDHQSAETAILTLNGRRIYDLSVQLKWYIQITKSKEDISSHYSLYVGDLSGDVDDQVLARAFADALGGSALSDARVMWDLQTGKTRGYGFVTFRTKRDAERAIQMMNGRQIGQRCVKINWAHNKANLQAGSNASGQPQQGDGAQQFQPQQQLFSQQGQSAASTGTYSTAPVFEHPKRPTLNLNTVLNQSQPSVTTVYVSIPPNTTTEMLQTAFLPYGHILDIKIHHEKGYAFVKMDSHENAAQAICYLANAAFNGAKLKVAWGKDKSGGADGGGLSASSSAQNISMMPSHQQQQQQQQTSGYEDSMKFSVNAFMAYQAASANLAYYQNGGDAQGDHYYQMQKQQQQMMLAQQQQLQQQQQSNQSLQSPQYITQEQQIQQQQFQNMYRHYLQMSQMSQQQQNQQQSSQQSQSSAPVMQFNSSSS